MIDRRHSFLLALGAMLFTLGLGCQSGPEPRDENRQQTQRSTSQMPMPSPEELGDNPCGNPRWATLPPGVGERSDSPREEPPEDDDTQEDDESNDSNE